MSAYGAFLAYLKGGNCLLVMNWPFGPTGGPRLNSKEIVGEPD
jgi:hypothetical protein